MTPIVQTRVGPDGSTRRVLVNPPLEVGRRFVVEVLRRGTYSGVCTAADALTGTLKLDGGGALTFERRGAVWVPEAQEARE